MLPQAFLERMEHQLGEEYPAFLASLERPRAVALRFNPLKGKTPDMPFTQQPVPWEPAGYYYDPESLAKILHRSADILDVKLDDDGAHEIASRCRGTPRIANNLLRRARDYAQVKADGVITGSVAAAALEMLQIDRNGLDEMDLRILEVIINNFRGGPVGLKNIAVSLGEDEDSLEDVYEPFLIQQGYLTRTSRGRVATPKAWDKLGISGRANDSELF